MTTPSSEPILTAGDLDSAYTATQFRDTADRILANTRSVIDGKPEATELALIVVLAEGHLLIEDVPGVGKTMLAKALARSIGCTVRRIQFTPDLLPSDVTGVSVFNQATRDFEFKQGAVFANIVIGDEINRASPKTQSALLECMEERQVTVDGHTHHLAAPFTVVATQNPLEMEGTYALPEAQRDRFMARISMGYPDASAELSMVQGRDIVNPLDSVDAVVETDELLAMIDFARQVYVAPVVEQYVVHIVQATRVDPELRLGASPRATLHLIRAAKVAAALQQRDFVLPDDIDRLIVPVLAHRLIPTRRSTASDRGSGSVVAELLGRIVATVPVPASTSRPG